METWPAVAPARRGRPSTIVRSSAGFLRLVGFSQGSPVQIKARNCATRIESLLAWEPAAPDQPLNSQALRWSGDENHLDVAGRSWIVIPAPRDSATVSVSVSNLETWSQLAQENDPVRGSLEFLTTTANRMDSPRPSDFAIKSAGSLNVGADPIRWARSRYGRGPSC